MADTVDCAMIGVGRMAAKQPVIIESAGCLLSHISSLREVNLITCIGVYIDVKTPVGLTWKWDGNHGVCRPDFNEPGKEIGS